MFDSPVDDLSLRIAGIGDAIEDALITTDLNSIITSWNAGAERLFGGARGDMIGQSILQLFPPGREEEERHLLARIAAGESVRNFDTVRRHTDGRLVPVSITVSPIVGADGTAIGTVRITRDRGEWSRVERAARRLAAIVESSDDAIISKDLNGIVTSWNRAAERMFGYTADEIVGRSIRTIIPDERQSEEDLVLSSIRRGEKVDHFETLRRRKDGTFVPISLTISPIVDETGRVIGASKIARDISDSHRLEADRVQALAVAEEHAAITEKLNEVGTLVASALDRETVVQVVVDAATALTGAAYGAFFYNVVDERSETFTLYAVSGAARDAFAQLPMPRNTPVLAPTFRGERTVRSDDITRDARYGQNPPYHGLPEGHVPVTSYLAVPVKARNGDVLGGLFFGHPEPGRFAERHERLVAGIASWASIALENARLYIGAQEASRLKDEFLATLSHELRTPLNAILGYARMIRAGIVAPDKQRKAIETIERNATSLTQIVEDVLDVSRIISGKMRLNVQPVELRTVVRNAVDAVLPAADAKGIRIETAIDTPIATAAVDPERLQQVVWNLMTNAVKFTGRGGTVRVSLQAVNSHAEIIVSDTGIGIAPAFLPHIFERFRQADAGTTRERGGLGLGLAIARQLVEMHGGTIQVASDGPGKGSTFWVRLPLMAQARESGAAGRGRTAARSPEAAIALPDLTGVRVLAVDDDGDALTMVREILEAAGAEVSTAGSAAQALDTIAQWLPDVLVADLGMPRMDGFDLIAQVRQHAHRRVRAVRAVALTAYVRSEDRLKALRSGYQTHLAKPIDPGELMATVAALIDGGAQPSA
jgi:PAS domain S-box-containing protein